MPWPYPYGRSVTFTNYVRDEVTQDRTAEGEPVTLDRCAFEPGSRGGRDNGGSERDGVEDSLTITATIFGPYDATVTPGATATIAGIEGVWEVDGEIRRWRSDLTGTEACSEIRLSRKAGAL